MHKIVINSCYGGFRLSALAVKRYYEIVHPDIKLYFYKQDHDVHYPKERLIKCDPKKESNCEIFTKDIGEIAEFNYNDRPYSNNEYIYLTPDRSDPALIQVVEELGEEANGPCADLEIVEIHSDKYRISEYDGYESVETPDSIHWETFN